jgi:hypothetical protein
MSKACCEMQLQRFRSMHCFLEPAFLAETKFGCFWSPCRLRKFRVIVWLVAFSSCQPQPSWHVRLVTTGSSRGRFGVA